MQLTQKHIISISAVAILVTLGYITLQNPTISSSDRGGIGTISQSGIETDSLKRLETVANASTPWGISPFGSGKPLSEEPKPQFQKPNTEWKARTINGITYRFGEGNPPEVAALSHEEKEIYSQCYFNTVVYAMQCPSDSQGRGQGYITSEIEKDLLMLLNHPSWEGILTKCEQQFRSSEISVLEHEANYDRIISGEYLSMENLMTIDDRDGRKILTNNFSSMTFWFRNAITEGNREIISPEHISKLNNCITQNGGFGLYALMENLYQKQFYPS
jgi:hypothetical protein